MLNTLMDISEAETGAMRLDLQRLNLGEALRDAVTLYEDVAEEKDVTVTVTAPEALTLVGDRNRLRQAFANLVDNAIKYNRRGGQVSIAAHADGAQVVVEVRDTGIGIAATDLPRIWERLYRGDASRSERGLGLGLSLVKAIVEAHGGTITAESTPTVGTMFRLHVADAADEIATRPACQLHLPLLPYPPSCPSCPSCPSFHVCNVPARDTPCALAILEVSTASLSPHREAETVRKTRRRSGS